MDSPRRKVAITGASGYIGRTLTAKLLARGHHVRALIRPGSRNRVVHGAEPPTLDLFNVSELARALWAVEAPPRDGAGRVLDVPQIRRASPAAPEQKGSIETGA